MLTDSELNNHIQTVSTLIAQQEDVKERMKPFKEELKELTSEMSSPYAELVQHVRATGIPIEGPNFDIKEKMPKEKKTFSVSDLSSVMKKEDISDLQERFRSTDKSYHVKVKRVKPNNRKKRKKMD